MWYNVVGILILSILNIIGGVFMCCTFFGHRNLSPKIEPILRSAIIDLIENHNVTLFYVGNHGAFDSMVYKVLHELSEKYEIKYYVVLAYLPKETNKHFYNDYSDTILPDGIENVPKKFAIVYRNKWMIKKSDYVITYIINRFKSNCTQFKEFAEKQGKTIIDLA